MYITNNNYTSITFISTTKMEYANYDIVFNIQDDSYEPTSVTFVDDMDDMIENNEQNDITFGNNDDDDDSSNGLTMVDLWEMTNGLIQTMTQNSIPTYNFAPILPIHHTDPSYQFEDVDIGSNEDDLYDVEQGYLRQ